MRTLKVRQDHALHQLQTERDVWVATAGEQGRPHLVPFSLDWDGHNVITATESDSITARNIRHSGLARLAVGDTRDVLLLDTQVQIIPVVDANPSISEHFNDRNGWDPRGASGDWVYLLMKPVRIHTWQSEAELEGRTIMRSGKWL